MLSLSYIVCDNLLILKNVSGFGIGQWIEAGGILMHMIENA